MRAVLALNRWHLNICKGVGLVGGAQVVAGAIAVPGPRGRGFQVGERLVNSSGYTDSGQSLRLSFPFNILN